MSDNWVDDRLDAAVGRREARRMRLEGFDKVEARVKPDGTIVIKSIDF
jgi:hypothetical protein